MREWPSLSQLCTQNGWIDDETLRYEIQQHREDEAIVAVWFTQILMESWLCFGKLHLRFDGRSIEATPI